MAQVIVREFADVLATYGGKVAQVPLEPKLADQTITTSGTSAASAAFNASTRMLGISTPAAGAVAYEVSATPGATPTAVITGQRLPANSVFYIGVRGADKIAFIDVT
jgi:hypothetical protein